MHTSKTLFGLVPNETKISHLMERLEAAHMHDISLLKLNEENSRGSMDEQRHEGDARHHKYEEKFQEEKHRKHDPRHIERGTEVSGSNNTDKMKDMKAINLPNLGQCQCTGIIEQELRQAVERQPQGKSPLCTSLVNRGLTDHEAHHFEDLLKSGQTLICIHSSHSEDLDRAHDILKKEGIKEISFSREKAKGHR